MSVRDPGRSTPPQDNSPPTYYATPQTDQLQEQHDLGSEDDNMIAPYSGSSSRVDLSTGTPFWGGAISPSPVPRSLECCCGKETCPNLIQFIGSSRGLEEELRLAAEVGQALLQQQKEMEEHRRSLEDQLARSQQEVQELQELVRELQQGQHGWTKDLEESQKEKNEVMDLVRELQQNQQFLETDRDDAQRQRNLVEKKNEALAAALEESDGRLRELTRELERRENEVKRLMANNIKNERSEEREEDLRRQMEDLKQELTVARKAESAAEARVRKLKGKYDSLHNSHEKLKRETIDNSRSKGKLEAVAILRESRDDLKSPPSNEANAHLITLIKELSSANNKLKSEITEYQEVLTESRNEVGTLQARIEDLEAGYSPYPSYNNNPFASFKGMPVQTMEGEEESPTAAAFMEEGADTINNMTDTAARPIYPQKPPSISVSSSFGPGSVNTFNSMGVDPSIASPVGSLVSSSMLSSSNPLHHHHHHHYHHHYPSENNEIVRGNSVFGELEKYIMKRKPRKSARRSLSSHTRRKERFVEIGEEDEEQLVSENNEKSDKSDSDLDDLMCSDESEDEGAVNGEKAGGRTNSRKKNDSKKDKSKQPEQNKAYSKKKLRASTPENQSSTTQAKSSVSLLSAGLKDAADSANIGQDTEHISPDKARDSNSAKGKDDAQYANRQTSSLSRHGSSSKASGSASNIKQHKPTQSSPLAARRPGSAAASSSLSVKVSQSSGSPATLKPTSNKPSIPAFKNPKFATLGPKERKQMMEAWRADVAKEQQEKNSHGHENYGVDNGTHATSLDDNSSDADTVKGKGRMDSSSSPVKDFVEEVLLDEANLSAAEAAALANEVEHGLSTRSRRTSVATRRTSVQLPQISVNSLLESENAKNGSRPPESPQHQNPYHALFNLGSNLMDRLKGTNVLALNRRLKRQFDILELSSLSNNLIENILADVENFRERFRWVEDLLVNDEEKSHVKEAHSSNCCSSNDDNRRDANPFSIEDFLPLVHLIQDILAEVCNLRMMVNDVQVSYFQKVEDSRRKAEEEFDRSVVSKDDDVLEGRGRGRRSQSNDGFRDVISRVFLGNQVQSPPLPTRHHSRRMSVDFSHDRDTSIGSIDTFAEETYFPDRNNVEGFSSVPNTLRVKKRRESSESAGSIFRRGVASFFGGGGDGGNSSTNPNTLNTVHRGEGVEKVGNLVVPGGGKKNLDGTLSGRNNSENLSKQQIRRYGEDQLANNGMSNSRNGVAGRSAPPTIRSSSSNTIHIGRSPTSPATLSSQPPPPKLTTLPRQTRTSTNSGNLERRLRQQLARTGVNNSDSNAGGGGRISQNSVQQEEGKTDWGSIFSFF